MRAGLAKRAFQNEPAPPADRASLYAVRKRTLLLAFKALDGNAKARDALIDHLGSDEILTNEDRSALAWLLDKLIRVRGRPRGATTDLQEGIKGAAFLLQSAKKKLLGPHRQRLRDSTRVQRFVERAVLIVETHMPSLKDRIAAKRVLAYKSSWSKDDIRSMRQSLPGAEKAMTAPFGQLKSARNAAVSEYEQRAVRARKRKDAIRAGQARQKVSEA
jgi:hypothetical protein